MTEFTHVYIFTLIRQLRGKTSFGERKREMRERATKTKKEQSSEPERGREGERETN